VFEHAGQTYMLPESAKAGEIALYRAVDASLDHWQRECALIEGIPGTDASVIRHGDRWWMFYAIVGPGARDQRELHVAHAPALTGPWQALAGNPVRVDRSGARPAGQPFHDAGGKVVLPVQDSAAGYGSALRLLRFDALEPDRVRCEATSVRLTGDLVSQDHAQGFHTLSSCGALTLIDVKRIGVSRQCATSSIATATSGRTFAAPGRPAPASRRPAATTRASVGHSFAAAARRPA